MWTVEREAHCEFNNGLFRGEIRAGSVIAATEFTGTDLHLTADGSQILFDSGDGTIEAQGGALNLRTGAATVDDVFVSCPGGRLRLLSQGEGVMLGGPGDNVAFYGTVPIARPIVGGDRSSGTALTNLLQTLENLGLIVDTTVG